MSAASDDRPCFGCGHIHAEGPGRCWEAACASNCPEDHGDFGGPYPYTPDEEATP